MRLEILGAPNRTYAIQASTNLKNWVTIGLCTTDAMGNAEFTDPSAGEYPARLYRVMAQ
jgi:hypothetical protein